MFKLDDNHKLPQMNSFGNDESYEIEFDSVPSCVLEIWKSKRLLKYFLVLSKETTPEERAAVRDWIYNKTVEKNTDVILSTQTLGTTPNRMLREEGKYTKIR